MKNTRPYAEIKADAERSLRAEIDYQQLEDDFGFDRKEADFWYDIQAERMAEMSCDAHWHREEAEGCRGCSACEA